MPDSDVHPLTPPACPQRRLKVGCVQLNSGIDIAANIADATAAGRPIDDVLKALGPVEALAGDVSRIRRSRRSAALPQS